MHAAYGSVDGAHGLIREHAMCSGEGDLVGDEGGGTEAGGGDACGMCGEV